MSLYTIIFGEYLRNEFTNIKNLSYNANSSNKTIKDIKDFITCYDDRLCICMLKYFLISSSLFSNKYIEYSYSNENEIKLNKIKDNNTICIMKIKSECNCGMMSNNRELTKLSKSDLIKENIKNKQRIEKLQKMDEWDSSKQKIENFYDIIIDINSILKVKDGWKIEMSPEGEKKYEEFKEKELIVIGAVGNMNKGKTFVLSKLSKIKLPSGTSINTKGISVKYPELEKNENRKYILLDSAGLETPILKNSGEDEIGEDIVENYNKFREKARDIIITEAFLQNFIISNSNILLLIVDILTYSEQKLINKIKDEIKKGKKEKKLFIIHNLKTFQKREEVKKYVNEVLFKSRTFDLQLHDEVTAENIKMEGEHFTEKETKGVKIYHLLFAADGSEAGNIYNNYTIKFIEKQYSDVFTKRKFDVINEVIEKFNIASSKILKEKIEIEDFISKEEIKEKKIIALKDNSKKIVLKKCYTDELGFQSFKGNGFEPQYNYFKNDKYIEIRVELPGSVEVPKVGRAIYIGDLTIIKIFGNKKKDKLPKKLEECIENTRDFGEFNIDIQFKTEKYKIKSYPKKQYIKNGIFYIKYEIEEETIEDNASSLVVEEEDDNEEE
jgi:hypothetical protein